MLPTCDRFPKRSSHAKVAIVVIVLLGGAVVSQAQPVLGSPEATDEAQHKAEKAVGLPVGGGGAASDPLARWGPFAFRPRIEYRLNYADGLQAVAGRPVGTYISTYLAALRTDVGEHWQLDYAAAKVHYSNQGFRDAVNQTFSLSGLAHGQSWTMALSEQYQASDTPKVETAQQVKEQNSDTELAATWHGNRMTADVVLQQRLTFREQFADNYEWSVTPNATWHFDGGIQAGAGVGAGYVLVYRASDMSYLRPSLHTTWAVSQKIAFNATAGLEQWRFIAGNRPDTSGLFYAVTAIYHPFDQTAVTITGSRQTQTSPFVDQVSQTQGWTVRLSQRLLKHFQLQVGVNQQTSNYLGPVANAFSRKDRLTGYDAALNVQFLRRFTASASYRYSKNKTDVPGFGFAAKQIGFQIGIRY